MAAKGADLRFSIAALFFSICFPTFALNYYAAVGAEVLEEKNQQDILQEKHLKNYSFGIGSEKWLGYIELSSFQESTASGSISVDRKVDHKALAGYFLSDSWGAMQPMMGAGLGYSTESIETAISGVGSLDTSRPNYFLFGALGLKIDMPYLWLSTELRIFGFEKSEPNPTADLLCKIGLIF